MDILGTLDGLVIAILIILAVRMAEDHTSGRRRAMSHKEYLDTLKRPTPAESSRISDIQQRKEDEMRQKYHTAEEHRAATTIQKAYRGHRERRQLNGLTLDPSERWVEAIKEWRYRSAIGASPRHHGLEDEGGRHRSDSARDKWNKVAKIAEHAVAGETLARRTTMSSASTEEKEAANSMLMDLRYFLEMVDVKHRYGTNLQVYHEEWQREDTKQPFFEWLDHGPGRHMNLPGCSREKLDRERIRYLSKEERKDYLVRVDSEGLLRWDKNDELINTDADHYKDSVHGIVPKDSTEPAYTSEDSESLSPWTSNSGEDSTSLHNPEEDRAHQQVTKDKTPGKRHFHVSPATILNHLLRASVKPGTWIYVQDTVGRLYVGIKASGAFQHASFLSGGRISSAGSIGIRDGKIVYLSPLSGHYRPTTKSFKAFIDSLKHEQGADLSEMRISGAYKVLLSMEYYGKTQKGLSKLVHPHSFPKGTKKGDAHAHSDAGRTTSPLSLEVDTRKCDTATEAAERHWRDENSLKKGLAKLMDDLHIKRR
jgi:hypothetical protein